MKTILSVILILGAVAAQAQSEAYQTMREKFRGEENVFAFGASGFFARAILGMAGEHDYKRAIKDVRNMRFIVVPKKAFHDQHVTVGGLKKVLRADGFHELAHVRDRGEDISLFLQEGKRDKDDRYFLLVEEQDEVVAFEIRGYVDPEELKKLSGNVSYNR